MRQLYADQHVQVHQEDDQVRDLLNDNPPPETEVAYRVRIGAMEITYAPVSGAWYVYLPGYERAALPVHTHSYYRDAGVVVNIDHDRKGVAYGIEIL